MIRARPEISRIFLRPNRAPADPVRSPPVTKLEAGQIYRKADAFQSRWQVVASFSDSTGVRHARLRNTADPTSIKLIAESALRNPKLYRLIGPEEVPRVRS
jgi:hypothetical protein